MKGEFSGKLVLVSGGSRGIGRSISEAFASQGAQTVLASSNLANLNSAVALIGSSGRGLLPDIVAADLRTSEGCERVFKYVADRHGRCDILVNSAGAARAGAFLSLSDEVWHDGFELKFFGCVRLCRLFWPMLVAAKGHVVNIIGGAARTPDSESMIGGAVNAAMNNFSKALSGLGKHEGVNVNAILPGMTETERAEQLFRQRAEAVGSTVEKVRAALIARDGLSRLGKPEDIAALTLFLCAEGARYIQGTAIAVDGGSTPGVY